MCTAQYFTLNRGVPLIKREIIFFSESIMGCVLTKNQCIDHPRDPFKTVASVSLVGELNTDIGITLLLRI